MQESKQNLQLTGDLGSFQGHGMNQGWELQK